MSNKIKKLNDFIEDEERRRVTITAYDIPEDWKIVRLGEYAEIFGGTTPPKRNPNYWNGKIPWATPTDITSLRSNFINDTSEKVTEKAVKECSLRIIEPGNVLLTSRATIGFAAINTTPMTINQGITAIIPNKSKIDSLFLVYLLHYMKKILEQLAGGSTFKEISRSTLRSLKIPLPPIDEQRRIAEVLSTVDEAIRLVDESIARTERLKKGLMQELLTKGLTLGFMFDTNVFDKILDGRIKLPRDLKYYATHIQYDEILSIPEDKGARKGELLDIFEKVTNENIATEGAVIGISRLGMAKFMSKEDAELYHKMLKRLRELDEKAKKMKSVENQARDILIALTCIKNCLTLVTDDKNLKKVAQEFQCPAITFEEFLNRKWREYKHTEIGIIPKEWKIIRLKDVALIIMGQSPPSSTYNKEGIGLPFLQGKMEFGNIYPSPLMYCSKPIKIAEANDILISVRAPVGDVNLAPYKLCIGRGLAAIRFNRRKADYLFYFYYLQKIKTFLEILGKGSTFKAIVKNDLETLKVPLPSLEEQRIISRILLAVDKELEVKRKRKKKLERIKRALMDLLLTGRVRIKVS